MCQLQPIETAPNETPVLIYDPRCDPPYAVAFYTESAYSLDYGRWELEWGDPGDDIFEPTHWMPLPEKPSK